LTTEKLHPNQKPVKLMKRLIKLFTDEYDVVIDPVAGSGSTLIAAKELKRHSYGFEVYKEFYQKAQDRINGVSLKEKEMKQVGYSTIFDYMEETNV
jgi:site-specific DNA-methyltransferase (adenine-specific)